LLLALQAVYGDGFRRNSRLPRREWNGQKVQMYYDERPIESDCAVEMWGVTMMAQRQADRKAAAEKAKKDL
jgi:hypothetical protein